MDAHPLVLLAATRNAIDLAPSVVKLALEKAGSQSKMAAQLQVREKTIRNWVHGVARPSLANLEALCEFVLQTDHVVVRRASISNEELYTLIENAKGEGALAHSVPGTTGVRRG